MMMHLLHANNLIWESESLTLTFKLRRLGSPNGIVDNLKSDSNKFRQQLYDDLDFKVNIGSYCITLIYFQSN